MKRTIEFHSSNNRLVFPPGGRARNIHIVMPNEMISIAVGMRANSGGTQRAIVNCVDINTKELV